MNLFDDPLLPSGTAPSAGSNFLGQLPLKELFRLLSSSFAPPDRMRQLQATLLELEIAQKLNAATVPYQVCDWTTLAPSTDQATVISGAIGSGKTALAVLLAQNSQPAFALDWPSSTTAKALHLTPCSWREAEALQDATLLVDEARITTKNVDLWTTIALARHRGLRLVYTTQNLAGITRDVLRLNPRLLWKRTPPLSSMFEREELQPIAAVATLLTCQRPPSHVACYDSGTWSCTDAPLPDGWSDAASRNRRFGL